MDANGERFFPRVDTHGEKGKKAPVRLEWWRNFLLHNPFVPLLFRFINLAFTTVTLAIAIRIHLLLKAQNATDAVGSSPVLAIVFAPLTLVHVAVQIYMEYFGRPIGLWGVRSKLVSSASAFVDCADCLIADIRPSIPLPLFARLHHHSSTP